MESTHETSTPPLPSTIWSWPRFLIAMAVYLTVVHIWSLTVYPLGRDYALMAAPETLPWLVRDLFALEMRAFGTFVLGYHAVNLVLLYGCMVALFFITCYTLGRQWWHASLAATLMMANPVKSEATLHLSGVADLLPAFLALAALALYAAHQRFGRRRLHGLALLLFALATLPFERNLPLVLVFVLYEVLIPPKETRNAVRLLPFLLVGGYALFLHRAALTASSLDAVAMFAPLHLIFYPIGFLPETLETFAQHPALGYTSACVGVLLLALIYRKARHPALLFAILAAVAMRLFQGSEPFDLVHRTGGGRLLVPVALLSLGAVALCQRIMEHPKWRQPTVYLSTLACVVLFVLQIFVILDWRRGGEAIQQFQAEAATSVVPNLQGYGSAPIDLEAAMRYTTPFSERNTTPYL